MQTTLRDTQTRHRCPLSALHPTDSETNMDEPRTRRRTVLTLLAACTITACTTHPTPPTTTPVESIGQDRTIDAQVALADLDAYLTSITTTTTVPRSAAAPRAVPAAPTPSGDRWDQLAQCETGGNWAANTGNGFGGGLQFMHGNGYSTWRSFGGTEYATHPWEATREEQIVVAERVLASSGWGAWPGCSRRFGWY